MSELSGASSSNRGVEGVEARRDGVVPFTWSCRRSGRCCSVPEGYVWLESGEAEAMARSAGLSPEAFRAQHIRVVPDPRPGPQRGQPQEALAEGLEGRCSLLRDRNECSVYESRPEHCRAFPDWASVLTDRVGFERARETCPGIAVEVPRDQSSLTFRRLDALAERITKAWQAEFECSELKTTCSRPPEEDREHFVSGLEMDWVLERAPRPRANAQSHGGCPWREDLGAGKGNCSAAAGRPLTCRLRAIAGAAERRETLAAQLTLELQELARASAWPASYGCLSDQFASRRDRHSNR